MKIDHLLLLSVYLLYQVVFYTFLLLSINKIEVHFNVSNIIFLELILSGEIGLILHIRITVYMNIIKHNTVEVGQRCVGNRGNRGKG